MDLFACYLPFLPEKIPGKINALGEAKSYVHKATLFILPCLALVLFVTLTFLNRHPERYNYLSKITDENRVAQYTLAIRMVRFLKLVIPVIFLLINFEICRYALYGREWLGVWLYPCVLFPVLGTVIYFLNKMVRDKLV